METSEAIPNKSALSALIRQGKLIPGTRLHLIKAPRVPMNELLASEKSATFVDCHNVRWDADGKNYSLLALCKEICQRHDGALGTGSFRGADHWAIEGDELSLTQRAKQE